MITLKIKNALEDRNTMDLNGLLLAKAELPTTMTQGKESAIKVDYTDPLSTLLDSCFHAIASQTCGLIIVDDSVAYLPTKSLNCGCKYGYVKILFDAAFKELKKPPPLYWVEGIGRSPQEEIMKWFTNPDRYLVTT